MRLQKLLGIKHPIIQAPMAGSDDPGSVAAVCNAGALGSLGAQYRTADEMRKAIAEIRRLTDKPFAINLFALESKTAPSDAQIAEASSYLQKYYKQLGVSPPSNESVKNGIDPDSQLQVVLEERVPVFTFTLGIPSDNWLNKFKEQSIILIGTATNVKEAQLLEEVGVDAITAQSAEAGGHRGTFIGTYENSMIGAMSLIPEVVDAVKVPVIAAGGIMDGRGIAAAFALGAEAVQLGTAFLTVKECKVHTEYKKAIREHCAHNTTITKVFSGGAARGIENQFILENRDTPLLAFPYHNAMTRPIRKMANEKGLTHLTNLWSGQSGRLAREVSTKELIENLVKETEAVMARLRAATPLSS